MRTCVEEKRIGLAGLEVETCTVAVADNGVCSSRQVVRQVVVRVQSYHWRRLFYTPTSSSSSSSSSSVLRLRDKRIRCKSDVYLRIVMSEKDKQSQGADENINIIITTISCWLHFQFSRMGKRADANQREKLR